MSQGKSKSLNNWNDPEYNVLQNLLRFTKNVEIFIDKEGRNANTAIKIMYAIN